MRRSLALLGCLLLLAGACTRDDKDEKPVIAEAPVVTGTGTPEEYKAATDATARIGREAVALFLSAQDEALHRRFSARQAEVTPPAAIATMRAQLLAAPLGDVVGEYAFVAAPDDRFYAVDRARGERNVFIQVAVDSSDKISGFLVADRSEPPPDEQAQYQSSTPYRFPVRGSWLVYSGGVSSGTNRHALSADKRHGIDLVVWKNGSTFKGAGTTNEEFWAWGQAVVAPASGRVITARDTYPDNRPGTRASTAEVPAHGNAVVIHTGSGEHIVFEHLRQGSVRVKAGEFVDAGQIIGLVGNSGYTTRPHLHVRLQATPLLTGQGIALPLAFSDVVVNGKREARGTLTQGQIVRAAAG